MSDGIRAMWMRGGTSKGGYFLDRDLPADRDARNALLLRIMGSPDPAQIDGLGGATPLTSKVAIVGPSQIPDVDVDYHFYQVYVDKPLVSDKQPCGNILAGVAPFAIERGLVAADCGRTEVVIRNTNTDQIVRAVVETSGGSVSYDGAEAIDGVPGTAAPVSLMFSGLSGSTCGSLLPTGREVDGINGVACTLIDNGMPAVVITATELGLTGYEAPETLEANGALVYDLEAIRLRAGEMMGLGDVRNQSVPKMCIVSASRCGNLVNTRCFIPHRCHQTLGVLCAVSIASACARPESPARLVSELTEAQEAIVRLDHPGGALAILLQRDSTGAVTGAGSVRTARKLFDGFVYP